MKKIIMTVAVLACASSMVQAQVSSANIVGYAKFTASKSQLSLVALNFKPSTNAISVIIGDQLPTGTALYVWDKDGNTYSPVVKAARGGWGSSTLELGQAFWVEVPGSAAAETYDVIMDGEVLLSETNSVVIGTGVEATGYYFPVETTWGSTDLAVNLPNGSALYIWNGAGYNPYVKAARGGWGDGATEVIGPTSGFWVETAADFSWNEARPFNQ